MADIGKSPNDKPSDGTAKDGAAAAPRWGQICWLEIPVSDVARAAKFYTAVFGWECTEAGKPAVRSGARSIHFFNKGGLHGGFMLMEEGYQIVNHDEASPERMPVLPTFCVQSIEETFAEVGKAGGRVHVPKTEIGGGMGVFGRFVDCEGNLVGIWAQE